MSITESLISSIILMLLVSSGTSLYMDSMGALRNSRIRDGVSSSISSDLEGVRDSVEGFRDNSSNGMLIYAPVDSDATQMGLNFILANIGTFGAENDLDGDGITDSLLEDLSGSQFGNHLTGITITRIISADSEQPHIVRVTYTTQGNSKVTPEHSSEIIFPAQGWLP